MQLEQILCVVFCKKVESLLTAFLDEMHAHDMKAFVCIRNLDFRRYVSDPSGFRPMFERAYADFGHHPAVFGFFIGDAKNDSHPMGDCHFLSIGYEKDNYFLSHHK